MEVTQTTTAREGLRALAAPLREQREQLLAEIATQTTSLVDLRAALADVDAVLRRLDPDASTPKRGRPPGTSPGTRPSGPRIEQLAQQATSYVETHADELADGFTIRALEARLRAAGVRSSTYSMRGAVEQMRDAGVIRAIKKTVGGGVLYAPMNGATHG